MADLFYNAGRRWGKESRIIELLERRETELLNALSFEPIHSQILNYMRSEGLSTKQYEPEE